ncbi:histidine phosphatase family protein [Paenibacillus sp. 19GGS1-52]|uniref:histidine phosphatase family protein n=1 Tax=Paenibacillus sp. 19GGS1-52 TaxID=2758563 RepID=UPI001EFC1FAA|nr:histidine phosphatase family protein [Paenibacillus sp. 19GGS1-52]ULO05927.1 histidine phosphatase family protein [Paenibacillus sp. 19GGS1-52]
MAIYIARHGETRWSSQNIVQGRKDSELTKEGIQQAILLSHFFYGIKVNALFSSPLGRAYNTAKFISGRHQIPIILEDCLTEKCCGTAEGVHKSELSRRSEKDSDKLSRYRFCYPGGENYEDLEGRLQYFTDQISRLYIKENAVIVAHKAINKILIKLLCNLDIDKVLAMDVPNEYIYCIEGNKICYSRIHEKEYKQGFVMKRSEL